MQTQMMLNALGVQIRLIHPKTKKIHEIVLNNHKVKVRESWLRKDTNRPCSTCFAGYLDMRKVCSKWVPSLLTVDPKQERVEDSERCLVLLEGHWKAFSIWYMTLDEIWIHDYMTDSKWQWAEWTAKNESQPKQLKTRQ